MRKHTQLNFNYSHLMYYADHKLDWYTFSFHKHNLLPCSLWWSTIPKSTNTF